MSDPHSPTEAELAALADGSLSQRSQERLQQAVSRSPELAGALAVQERALELTRSVDVKAPASLHKQISSLRADPANRPTFIPRLAAGGALATVVGAVVVVLVIALNPGAGHPPSLAQISALTLGRATLAAPVESTTRHSQLAVSVQGVPFPYWGGHLGWHSTGTRIDRIENTAVTTVFYANSRDEQIGYAILAGSAPETHGGKVLQRDGVSYRLLRGEGGVSTVTWQRAGHLCVVSGRHVRASTLLRLASWNHQEVAT